MIEFLIYIALSTATLDEADAFMQAEEYQQAIQAYQSVLRDSPDSYPALLGLARAFAFSDQWDEAITAYTEILEKYPDDPDALLGRARVYGWQENFKPALKDARQVVEHNEDYPPAWQTLGSIYYWSNQNQKAIEAYNRWIDLEPENVEAYIARARAYNNAGQLDNAQNDLSRAKELGATPDQIPNLTPPGGQQSFHPWKARLFYEYSTLSEGFDDWHAYGFGIVREFEKGSLGIEGTHRYRFNQWDETVAFDGYLDLWHRAYGHARIAITPDADFWARTDWTAELYQGIGEGWELSGSYQNKDYSINNVDIYGVGLGKYIGQWFGRVNVYFTPETDKTMVSYTGFIRHYFDDEDFIEFRAGIGEEASIVDVGPTILNLETRTAATRYQNYFSERFGYDIGYTYLDVESTWDSHTFHFNFLTRW